MGYKAVMMKGKLNIIVTSIRLNYYTVMYFVIFCISCYGGFGGGGSLRGGGGGFTGGNGGTSVYSGSGGGSFNIDPNGTKTLGWFEDGKCEIKFIK